MSTSKYPNGISLNFETGGREAIERLVAAYGFSTRQALADHLNVSKSTLANRYLRDTFPSDWIIKCSLETGASLTWLTTGTGPVFDDAKSDVIAIARKKILNGELFDSNYLLFDKAILSGDIKSPICVVDEGNIYLADSFFDEVTDGKWLVEIEGKFSIRELTRIPVAKVKVTGAGSSFECLLADIKVLAKCFGVYKDI
ncbi:phage repressor protein CI [Enterobacter roggenkampii]|uniref:phage repressor protein CI n=1 Tax=Enterobacter roggenkampii TaxID=1812935 RepID=UPI002DBB6E92|nr:phage repressor protein CI [Enterobacter roggenkampii]MEB6182482.1 helix-turn-helix domain-containing protein [Enterobacter roggenkampii]